MQTNDSGHVAVPVETSTDPRLHTATPWFYQENSDAYTHIVRPEHSKGMIVAQLSQDSSGQSEADARFIVRACNRDHAFDDLVAAVAQAVDKDLAYLDGEARGITHGDVQALRAALRKAGTNN